MTRKLLTFSSQRRRENNALNSQDFMILYCWLGILSVFICAVPGMHQLYFDCHSRLFPIHLFKKTRSTIKQWKCCRLLMKFFQTGRKQKGKVQFLLQLPPSTFVNLLDGIAACWYTAKFMLTRITGIRCELLEALKITGYFGGDIPFSYKNCFF